MIFEAIILCRKKIQTFIYNRESLITLLSKIDIPKQILPIIKFLEFYMFLSVLVIKSNVFLPDQTKNRSLRTGGLFEQPRLYKFCGHSKNGTQISVIISFSCFVVVGLSRFSLTNLMFSIWHVCFVFMISMCHMLLWCKKVF